MIRKVIIRRFKRFETQEFMLSGHVVLAGPNNMGKTTVLQAIAAWDLAFAHWKKLNDFQRHGGGYPKAPIARQAFMAVPLRNYDLMWTDRRYTHPIEIEVQTEKGETLTMEFLPDSTEQIYVRPKNNATPQLLRGIAVRATYIPPMSGLSVEEPVYQKPKIDQLLALQKPGEVLRNLMVEAHRNETAWRDLSISVRRLFGCEILPPDATGADIIAEFRAGESAPRLDIRSAGSGFQQVLMLLAFLHTRPGAVLLIDEPDAHLHVYLQDTIYSELRAVAARTNAQLIVATHSEVIINSVAPSELCALYATPKRLSDAVEQRRLADSLGTLTQTDVLLAIDARGILYLEGHTDLDLLREWARILDHPVHQWLTKRPFWRATVAAHREGGDGIQARVHYEALQLVKPGLPGLILDDGDGRDIGETPLTGTGLQRVRWRRYEAESYLMHPAALERFVAHYFGGPALAGEAPKKVREALASLFGAVEVADQFAGNPHQPAPLVENFLRTTKARKDIIPVVLTAAGIHGFDYTRFHEIAALMKPEEIHPEVREKLDAIKTALAL